MRGTLTQDVAAVVGDFVVRRNDGVASYQLAVVVDDAAAAVSHVLRGEDLLHSTPRQLQLSRALGLSPPRYAHVPLLLGEDGKPLGYEGTVEDITERRLYQTRIERQANYDTLTGLANRRGFLKAQGGPRIGGIVYAESARKVAYFVETAERLGTPLIYLQDVSGFMVGPDAEREGIIRAGAEMVETMSCATVPKIVVTLNHASGAGYYAMAGQGFDPHFTFSWPTARIGVMEGDSAVVALYAAEMEKHDVGVLPVGDKMKNCRSRTPQDLISAICALVSGTMCALPPSFWMRTLMPSAVRSVGRIFTKSDRRCPVARPRKAMRDRWTGARSLTN